MSHNNYKSTVMLPNAYVPFSIIHAVDTGFSHLEYDANGVIVEIGSFIYDL